MDKNKILVLNVGSIFEVARHTKNITKESLKPLATGLVDEIGKENSHFKYQVSQRGKEFEEKCKLKDHKEALDLVICLLTNTHQSKKNEKLHPMEPIIKDRSELLAIGHRVVHGGESFKEPTLVTDEVLKKVKEVSQLAPLHNPINLKGYEEARKLLGKDLSHVMVFDTAFHATLPPHSFMYAIPHEIYQKKQIRFVQIVHWFSATQTGLIRKYGFHGTSFFYVAKETSKVLGRELEELNLIILHLGNGCSACAIKNGKSIDTSMGLTPLQGLMMGTRSGDIDPACVFYMPESKNSKELLKMEEVLNKKSGLLGVCGTNDMREVIKRMQNDKSSEECKRAKLAFDMFTYRVRQYIGAYFVTLGGADAIVFTGGIGENSPEVREDVCNGLECIGIKVESDKNQSARKGEVTQFHDQGTKVKLLAVPTDEDLEIAMQTLKCKL